MGIAVVGRRPLSREILKNRETDFGFGGYLYIIIFMDTRVEITIKQFESLKGSELEWELIKPPPPNPPPSPR